MKGFGKKQRTKFHLSLEIYFFVYEQTVILYKLNGCFTNSHNLPSVTDALGQSGHQMSHVLEGRLQRHDVTKCYDTPRYIGGRARASNWPILTLNPSPFSWDIENVRNIEYLSQKSLELSSIWVIKKIFLLRLHRRPCRGAYFKRGTSKALNPSPFSWDIENVFYLP